MAPRLSIIIPALNAARELPPMLDALLPGLEAGLITEVIVADGGSEDDTRWLADAAGAQVLRVPSSRGGQLRAGAEVARADWFLFLHADTQLGADWPAAAAVHMQHVPDRAATFRLKFRADGVGPRLVAGWANLRTRVFGLPYGDQGLLVPRGLYQSVGGHPDQPLMEDVALVRALPKIALLPVEAATSAERYIRGGWVRRGARNLLTLLRYFAGADPQRLAKSYHRS